MIVAEGLAVTRVLAYALGSIVGWKFYFCLLAVNARLDRFSADANEGECNNYRGGELYDPSNSYGTSEPCATS